MADTQCVIDGCEQIPRGRGYCNKHYHTYRRLGDHRANADAWAKYRPRNGRVGKVDLTCGTCSSAFSLYPSQLGGGSRSPRGLYCSRECADIGKRRGDELKCEQCGTIFYKRLAEQDSDLNFCSTVCYFTHREANRRNTYPKIGQRHEHRIVAARALGRRLRDGEVVHHMDEIKTNNAVENLCVFPSQSHHARWHKGGMTEEEMLGYALKNGAPSLG